MKKQKPAAESIQPLTPQGIYAAVVKSVAVTTKQGTEEPEQVQVEFALNGVSDPIVRSYPAKVEGRSPLVRDSKTIRGHGFTRDEDADGFDPAVLVGKSCQVVVAHRPDLKGKTTAQIGLVMTPVITVAAGPVAAVAS